MAERTQVRKDAFIGDADDLKVERTADSEAAERGLSAFQNGEPRSVSKDEPEELRASWLHGWDLGKETEGLS